MVAISVVTSESPPASTNVIKSTDTSSNTPTGTEEPSTTDGLAGKQPVMIPTKARKLKVVLMYPQRVGKANLAFQQAWGTWYL